MPKRKLSDAAGDFTSVPPPHFQPQTQPHLQSSTSNNTNNANNKPNYRLQTSRLKAKFDFGVTSLSRALKAARGSERQKLGRRQKTATEGKNDETLRRIEGEIKVLKDLDPTSTAEKYLFKQLLKTKRVAEAPIFKRFKQSKLIKLESPKSTEEANVTARLFKSAPVRNVLPGILEGLKSLPGLEGKKKDEKEKEKHSSAKDATNDREKKTKVKGEKKVERAREMSISGDESDDAAAISRRRNTDVDMDMNDISGSEADSEEDYAQFDARLASESGSGSEDDDDGDDGDDSNLRTKSKSRPTRSSISITPSPEPEQERSFSLSPTPEPSPQKKPKSSTTATASTTFLPSLMMGGYFSGSDSEPEALEELPKRKNRMGQQARRALWEKKYGAGAKHVAEGKNQPKNSKKGRDSGWDVRKGATDGERNRKKWGTGSNAMAMEGKMREFGQGSGGSGAGKAKKANDDKPLHPSWEAARKAKEAKSSAAFAGKKVVFD
ncbi:Bud-site selection protein [Aspergillus karnatakaensis]|uniref:BUD22 family protein n=1 Tax=Aspergillus karnatakaensis TaxID=1810916 RepID=UPI003CCD8F86